MVEQIIISLLTDSEYLDTKGEEVVTCLQTSFLQHAIRLPCCKLPFKVGHKAREGLLEVEVEPLSRGFGVWLGWGDGPEVVPFQVDHGAEGRLVLGAMGIVVKFRGVTAGIWERMGLCEWL